MKTRSAVNDIAWRSFSEWEEAVSVSIDRRFFPLSFPPFDLWCSWTWCIIDVKIETCLFLVLFALCVLARILATQVRGTCYSRQIPYPETLTVSGHSPTFPWPTKITELTLNIGNPTRLSSRNTMWWQSAVDVPRTANSMPLHCTVFGTSRIR